MTDRPNIVMVTWDSVRADHTPMYGYERDTCPFVNEKAEEGLVFENTQVSAVGTPASFSGILTGEHAAGVQINPNPDHWVDANADRTFLQEHLQDEGYYTGGFHFNALMSEAYGWDRGWDVYEDHMWSDEKGGEEGGWRDTVHGALQRVDLANFAVHFKNMVEGEYPAQWESMWDEIATFVEEAPEPFFLWVLLIDTHHPYYAPDEHHEWPQAGIRSTYAWNYVMRRWRRIPGERRPSIVNAYDNTIRYADAFVERLADKLGAEGHGDAPFIVHSDHGDELGEHANYGHRPLMYDTVTRVPLVMWNVDESGRVAGPNSLLDLGNTVLELADSDVRMGEGRSLLDDEARETVTVQNLLGDIGRTAAAVDDEWKVLYHPEGDWGAKTFDTEQWEAYRHEDDPMERDDRWGDHPEELEAALRDLLATDVSDVDEGEAVESADVQERLSELGYLE
jgi:arylsulfatase